MTRLLLAESAYQHLRKKGLAAASKKVDLGLYCMVYACDPS